MAICYIREIGDGLYFVRTLEGVDPGFGQGGGPVDPGYGRPGWGTGRPDNSLPGGGLHPGNRPPGSYPGRPDNSLPGGGQIGQLPSGPPPQVNAGEVLVLVRDQAGVWHYGAIPSAPPPRPLPEPPVVDNTLPPTAEPK